MPGRHQAAASGRRPRLRWLVAVAGGAVVGATLLAITPAAASSTVSAQLSLSGVATSANVLGGSEIGVHPGDKVVFKASALPTAGLENIPSLGPLLENLLATALGQYQVVVKFGSAFPGGAQTVTLGGPTTGNCAGLPSKSFTFPDKGTYAFTWKVQYVLPSLLGCAKNGLSDTDLNQLAKAGVALNANNSWVGKIIVADNPPKGGISIQLPGVSVAPNIGGHQLPTLGVPGVTLPTIAVPVPNLTSAVPGAGGSGNGGKTQKPTPAPVENNPIPVPAQVVPGVNGGGLLGGGGGYNVGALPGLGSVQGAGNGGQLPTAASSPSPALKNAADQNPGAKRKTVELAASRPASTGEVWVVLAIVAVIALAFVAATYARLYLMRHDS
jgi:hypothetical protein